MNTRDLLRRLAATNAPAAAGLVRIAVGGIFLSEGIHTFLLPAELGVGCFAKIGLPAPGFLAPFVGVCEVVAGLLVLIGVLTRVAAVPLLIDKLVAIATTKIPILLHKGFWAMATKRARTSRCCSVACFSRWWAPGPTRSTRVSPHLRARSRSG